MDLLSAHWVAFSERSEPLWSNVVSYGRAENKMFTILLFQCDVELAVLSEVPYSLDTLTLFLSLTPLPRRGEDGL